MNRVRTTLEWMRGLSAGFAETADDFRDAWHGENYAARGTGTSETTREIADRQFMAMMRDMPANLVATGLGVMLWLIAMGSVAPSIYLALWGAWACGTVVMAAFSYVRFVRSPPTAEALVAWKVSFRRGLVVVGLQWGCVMFLPAPAHVVPYMAIGTLLVIAGAVSLFATDRASISLIAAPCALLASASLALDGHVLGVTTGVGFAVAVALLVRLSRVHNTSMTDAMLVAEERQTLLEELNVQRRNAEQASAAKTHFLASVSHDLCQPMHSIALLVAAARQRGKAEAEVIEQIDASVRSMDDLLSALLEVSQFDAGAVALQRGTFPIADVLEQVRLKFEPQARGKGLELEVRASPLQVHSDFFQLERIVSNLVANAIRYTRHGGVRVRCRERGKAVWVQVWDSGIGIARQHRHMVFEEFFQVPRAARVGKQGLGLGLSIVQRAAHRLNHTVRVRSREGKGSLFEVALPAATSEDRSTAQLAPLLDGRLILLIDDDDSASKSMAALLGAFNNHVLIARSAAEALEVVHESLRLPDLIISDYRLADGQTGLEAVERVRALAEESIPALIVTGEPRSAQAAGIPVLPKPVQTDALASALKHLRMDNDADGNDGSSPSLFRRSDEAAYQGDR